MVQPVELQNVLAKTPAAERITQLQKANPENDQRQSIMVVGQKSHDSQGKAAPAVQSEQRFDWDQTWGQGSKMHGYYD